jgi:6-phosphogluconolactonase
MKKLLALTLISCCLLAFMPMKNDSVRFYIGSLVKEGESPITLCELDLTTGKITQKSTFSELKGPGYICLSPDQKTLFAVTQDHKINALSVGPEGQLKLLSSQPSEGLNPAHVSVHPSGRMAFLANYTGGSMAAYAVGQEGTLQPAAYTEQYSGSGPDKSRQEKPHAHSALPTPNSKYLYVADLGTDRIMNYVVDAAKATLTPNPAQPYFASKPGAGPRHMEVHPSGKYLFVLHEMEALVTSFSIDDKGVLREIQTVNSLPADFQGSNKGAAIRLHPNGRFLYVSNRGYNGITGYRIADNGRLEQVGHATESIDTPRDFNLDPTGKFLLVANMETNNLAVYRVDAKTGRLSFQEVTLSVKTPTCIAFLK